MTPEVLTQLKFIWAHMITCGIPTNGEWDYYSSNWENPERYYSEKLAASLKALRAQVLEVGVDWDRMDVPVYEERNGFADSESPSDQCPTLLGELVLKDGTKYILGVADADTMCVLASKNLQHLKEMVAQVKTVFGDRHE